MFIVVHQLAPEDLSGGARGKGLSSELVRAGGPGIAGHKAGGGERRFAENFPGGRIRGRELDADVLGMNPTFCNRASACASTSNRNFEGRQGRGGRTHLVSPMMAAAAAISGHFTDIRKWKFQ